VRRRRPLSGRLLAAVVLAASLTACGQSPDMLHKTQLMSMGTLVDISIWTKDGALAQRAINAVTEEFSRDGRRWHAWKPGELTKINGAIAAGKPAALDAQTRDLIAEAQATAVASGELFNPAIGRLIGLWGFHTDDRPPGPPPGRARIEALLKLAPTMADLRLDGDRLRSTNPNVQLDLGGIAKGYAVNLAVERIRKLGVQNAIVDAGGDLRAIGRHGDRPWRIGIRNPKGPGVIASLTTRGDESVFTSGDYERYFTYQGKRYHHIIDPRTGYPSVGTASVTVIDRDGAKADAAATALMIAGPDGWRRTAKAMGITTVMLVTESGTVYMTPSMAGRIEFEAKRPAKVIVEAP